MKKYKTFAQRQWDCEFIYACDCRECSEDGHCSHEDNNEGNCRKEYCPFEKEKINKIKDKRKRKG